MTAGDVLVSLLLSAGKKLLQSLLLGNLVQLLLLKSILFVGVFNLLSTSIATEQVNTGRKERDAKTEACDE